MEAQSETLTWNGSEFNPTWGGEENWLSSDGTPTRFYGYEAVKFDDDGSEWVILDGSHAPESVLVFNSPWHNYTFVPSCEDAFLRGGMQLIKKGSGTLTLTSFNNYTGGTFIEDGTLRLGDDFALGSGDVNLTQGGTLDLASHNLSNNVNVTGKGAIGNGSLSGNLTVYADAVLTLRDDLDSSGNIILRDRALMVVSYNILSESVQLGKEATIRIFGEYGTADIKTREGADSALLEKVSVSDGLIAGTDRQASLADGLDISSMLDDMTLENLVLTANNSISVGNGHPITLNNVTIKLSEDYFDRENPVDGVYYFKLQDLFHCDVKFNNAVFDASGLELPEGFDPGVNGIGMDFGTDVTIDPQTAKNLTLLMGDHWSQTMNLVDGKPVFTALVPTPEPATGTLSLLALAGLAARRRRK